MKEIREILAQAKEQTADPSRKVDYVSYSAVREGGRRIATGKACYSGALDVGLGSLEILCRPYKGDGARSVQSGKKLPAEEYLEFFRLCSETGLLPTDVQASHEKGENRLLIPRSGWDRHSIYITLCYYRQADICPGEAALAVELQKQLAPKGTAFLQILHYLAATTTIDSGHYFLSFGTYAGGLRNTDLAVGRALAWFAGLSKEKRLALVPKPKKTSWGYVALEDSYTYTMFVKKAKELASGPSNLAGSVEELLHPKHAACYESLPKKGQAAQRQPVRKKVIRRKKATRKPR